MKKYIYFLIYVTNQEQQKREEREGWGVQAYPDYLPV